MKIENFYIILTMLFFLIFGSIFEIGKKKQNRECLVNNDWYVGKKLENYSLGKINPKYLILHHSRANNIGEIKEIFEDYSVSCHYFIDKKGKIHNIVDDSCGAYHAGVSYWRGDEKLNSSSLCIEILNNRPFEKDINKKQYKSLIKLSKKLVKKYDIKKYNVLSHSDVAYFSDKEEFNSMNLSGNLNRKQDISYLFNWKKLSKYGVGFWYNYRIFSLNNNVLFYYGDIKEELIRIKEKLKVLGYKTELNGNFDTNFLNLSTVFHRRFFPKQLILASQGLWTEESTLVLNEVIRNYKRIIN